MINMTELMNSKQPKDEPFLSYINRLRSLSPEFNRHLPEAFTIEL